MSLALQEEVAALTGDLKSDATISINAASTEFVSLYLCKTPYKEATLTLRFPDDYPISACFVALESHSLPLKLVKRLTKVLEQEAERAKGGPQIARVVKLLSSVIASNYLIACGQEIRRIREMLAPAPLASGSAPSTSSSTSSSTAPPVPPASGGAKRGAARDARGERERAPWHAAHSARRVLRSAVQIVLRAALRRRRARAVARERRRCGDRRRRRRHRAAREA